MVCDVSQYCGPISPETTLSTGIVRVCTIMLLILTAVTAACNSSLGTVTAVIGVTCALPKKIHSGRHHLRYTALCMTHFHTLPH